MASLPADSIDCIWTDPPYLLSNDGITCVGGRMVKVNKGEWDRSRGVDLDHGQEVGAACGQNSRPFSGNLGGGTFYRRLHADAQRLSLPANERAAVPFEHQPHFIIRGKETRPAMRGLPVAVIGRGQRRRHQADLRLASFHAAQLSP